jgi:uncharacterized protein YgiM (DUF1202 family)
VTFPPAGVASGALPTLLLVLLLTACGGPAPVPGSVASPVPATPDIATAFVEGATLASPALASPVAVATAPATVAAPSPIQATVQLTVAAPLAPAPPSTVMPTPGPERLLVVGGGSPAVNMRSDPGTGSGVVKSVRDGTEVVVIGTDREADGRIWRNVQDGDASGWIVSTALRLLPTPTVTPSNSPLPSVTPTAASSPTPTPTATVSASATATATPTPDESAAPAGEPVEVFGTGGQGANLRAEPGTGGQLIRTLPDGTHLTVIGPDREAGGLTWRNVRGDGGTTGWIVADAVRSLATPSPTPTAPATATAEATSTATASTTSTAAATPTPAPATPTPAPGASEADTPSAPGTPTATPSPAEAAPPDEAPPSETEEPTPAPETVEVYGTGGTGANLRAQPGRAGTVIQSVPDGVHLTIIGDDETVDGLAWRHVQTDDGVSGWLAQEVVRQVVTPTATPRPGAPGIGAPIAETPRPEAQLTDAELAARPCRPGQVKGDASTGFYYSADHPDYPGLLQRVRCFDDVSRARASGFRPPEPSDASPTPEP